jgi:hypothetical protein
MLEKDRWAFLPFLASRRKLSLTAPGMCLILDNSEKDELFSVALIWPDQIQFFRIFV